MKARERRAGRPEWVEEIIGPVELGDPRRVDRLARLVGTLADRPAESLPQACGDWGETLAAYRFLGNSAVAPEALAAGLGAATAARCAGQEVILAIQDTTSLDYTSHRATAGLGPLEHPRHRGLFVHSALALNPAGTPLGLLALDSWARDPVTVGRRHHRQDLPIEAKESAKWLHTLKRTEDRLAAIPQVVTIADREADLYDLFALAATLRGDWLIRARHNRRVADREQPRLRDAVAAEPATSGLTVEVSRTPQRAPRTARLEVRHTRIRLTPPRPRPAAERWLTAHPEQERLVDRPYLPLTVGVVWVTEIDPPAGEKPLDWLVITSLPVATPAQALECVRFYQVRWLIERFHFVLKSGCRIEQLQLEQADHLRRAVAVYAAVAWRLLWLTYQARQQPEDPATQLVDDVTWQALHQTLHPSAAVPAEPPTLRLFVRQIARLGGFLDRAGDGDPGVIVLWRGLRRLADIVTTWRLAHGLPPPPQPLFAICV